MKKSYKIEVDCANCAQKMEDAANTVAGVAPNRAASPTVATSAYQLAPRNSQTMLYASPENNATRFIAM